ncbi:MAG: hypothetical protein HUJ61_00590 [Bacilli bacterium]|nr:hypothetical protein [Bacilli bacterium]
MLNIDVENIISFAKKNLSLEEDDVTHSRLVIYKVLGLDYVIDQIPAPNKLDANVEELYLDIFKDLKETEKFKEDIDINDIIDLVFDAVSPSQHDVITTFIDKAYKNVKSALEDYESLLINNHYIYSEGNKNDCWKQNDFNFTFNKSSNFDLKSAPNKRAVRYNNFDKPCFIYFRRRQQIEKEFEIRFEGDIKNKKEGYILDLEFVQKFPHLFLCAKRYDTYGGLLSSIDFFKRPIRDTIKNKFFKNSTIDLMDSRWTCFKLQSTSKDELADFIIYIENAWTIYKTSLNDPVKKYNYCLPFITYEDDMFTCYLFLKNEVLDNNFKSIFGKDIISNTLLNIDVVSFDPSLQTSVSRLANIMSDKSFDIDWYINSNPELKPYKDFIVEMSESAGRKMGKDIAINLIKDQIAEELTEELNKLSMYDDNDTDVEKLNKFIDILAIN